MPKAVFLREVTEGETRVAATPETVRRLVAEGLAVHVEAGAGATSGFPDEEYEAAGAVLEPDVRSLLADADLVLKVNPPEPREEGHEADLIPEGALVVGFFYPHLNPDLARKLAARKVSCFAMELIPRITRAQRMDALSSQSNLAGYKAVVMAADALPKLFPLLMTAAGTIKPVKVVVLGAGVAGLQAVATARRLGALVSVSDIRPEVKEQVESLGGRFIDIPTPGETADAGGYAKDLGEEFLRRQREILTRHIGAADVVITTALIPGRPAPRLMTREMVEAMQPGSVVVDLAAVMGGNCELTRPGETVEHRGVRILGEENVPGLVPHTASEMYARNVLAVVRDLLEDGEPALDLEDEILAGALAVHEGEIRHEPTRQALSEGGEQPCPES